MSPLSQFFLIMILSLNGILTPQQKAEQSYFNALKYYKNYDYKRAYREFYLTLKYLALQHPKTKKQRHLLTLGRCDIFYHLAQIDLRRRQMRASCKHLYKIILLLPTLPPHWKRWRINTLLPRRFQRAKLQFQHCLKIPSLLHFHIIPKNARIFYKHPSEKKWKILSKSPLALLDPYVSLLIKAKGFFPRYLKQFPVPRWEIKHLSLQLKPLPAPKRRPIIARTLRKTPPPKKKLTDSPFFWIGIAGVVVAAGTITTLALLPSEKNKPQNENIILKIHGF